MNGAGLSITLPPSYGQSTDSTQLHGQIVFGLLADPVVAVHSPAVVGGRLRVIEGRVEARNLELFFVFVAAGAPS